MPAVVVRVIRRRVVLRLPSSFRFRVPLIVLLASIGLTALAVVDAQRAVRVQQAVTQRALREYAAFAAWSYAQHVNEGLTSLLRESLGAVNHGDNMHTNPNVPDAGDLAHYLPWDAQCMCHHARSGPDPETFFALKIGSDRLDVGFDRHDDRMDGWDADRPVPAPLTPGLSRGYSPDEKRWLVDTLTRRIRSAGQPDHGYTLVVGGTADGPLLVGYTLMPTSWGDTMVYGARYSTSAVSSMLAGVLDGNGLLPSTFTAGRRNREVLAVRVRDHAGHTIFDSAPGLSSPLEAHIVLPGRAGLFDVDAIIRPEVAGTLIIGGLAPSRLPFLLGLLGLAAALAVVAVAQLRREGELARLQADFVSSVSHELRTPLAQIKLYLETLRLGRAKTDAEREWSLGHIDRETTRLHHLVENVLRFSRFGRGDATLAQPAHVAEEIERVVEEFRPLAASRRARIVTEVLATPILPMRPEALRHVLLNLLDNAVKYGPNEQTVRVTLGRRDGDVMLTVADEGPGVPAREREQIWSPFMRGAAARATGGSGIGLTIVREIVEQHGGRCWVEPASPPATARGARFVVTFPMHPIVVPNARTPLGDPTWHAS
jgi:signal transduction histidine kinase